MGCAKSLVIFSLKRQTLSEQLSVLDFERVLILHIQGWSPSQVAFCAGYIALQTELEVLVVKLTPQQKSSQTAEQHVLLPEDIMTETSLDEDAGITNRQTNIIEASMNSSPLSSPFFSCLFTVLIRSKMEKKNYLNKVYFQKHCKLKAQSIFHIKKWRIL